MSYDLALLHSASRFDLSSQAGRTASAHWLRALFAELVTRVLHPRLVLELGAAEAGFSRQIRPLLEKGDVHALEANPYVFRKHKAEADRAGIFYHNLAVGPESGETVFKVATSKAGQSLSRTKTNNSILTKPLDMDYEDVTVPMTSVDDFVAGHGLGDRPCAMWVDVEGLAFEVLSGASSALKHARAVLVEVEDKPFWTGQKLSGEVKSLLYDAGFIPVARDFEYNSQYNVLFVERSWFLNPHLRLALEHAFAGKAPD